MKKILFLLPYSIYKQDSGGKKRILNIIKALQNNAKLCFAGFGKIPDHEFLSQYGDVKKLIEKPNGSTISKFASILKSEPAALNDFRSEQLQQTINALIEKETFDAVWVNEIFMTPYLNDKFKGTKIIDRHKPDSLFITRMLDYKYKGIVQTGLKKIDIRNIRQFELKIPDMFDLGFLPSGKDIEMLTEKEKRFYNVLPNVVDLNQYKYIFYSQRKQFEKVLIFGNWEYLPNCEGLDWFFNEIYSDNLKLKIKIAGAGSEQIKELITDREQVEIEGYCTDINDVFKDVKAMIVPLKTGFGTRVKVLEAMACGVPIISTPEGVEGLNLLSEKHYLRFVDKKTFLFVLKQLNSENLKVLKNQNQLYSFLKEKFSIIQTGKALEEILNEI